MVKKCGDWNVWTRLFTDRSPQNGSWRKSPKIHGISNVKMADVNLWSRVLPTNKPFRGGIGKKKARTFRSQEATPNHRYASTFGGIWRFPSHPPEPPEPRNGSWSTTLDLGSNECIMALVLATSSTQWIPFLLEEPNV